MNWDLAAQISGAIQNAVGALAIVGGAAWGYFRFIRFRTLKPRLDFSFHWTWNESGGAKAVGIVTTKVTNRGNTKIDLRKHHRHRCFLKYALLAESAADHGVSLLSLPGDQLEHLDVVFAAHGWIEPGETIDDVKALQIPTTGAVAIQFEVVIFGAQKWAASAAFPLGREGSSTSEDEQDTYEEWEAAKEELRSSLARANRALSSLTGSDGTRLENVIQEADSLLSRLGSRSGTDQLIREVRGASDELAKYSAKP